MNTRVARLVPVLVILLNPCVRAGERQMVRPVDHGRALVNPQMGWTMHFYSNIITNYGSRLAPSDTLDDFPGLSCAYLRVPWSFLEPEEGRFNWSLLDTPAQRWIDKGKQIALRISSTESWMRWATPQWVHDAGAKGYDFTVGKGVDPNGPYWEPDYKDPVFLDKLDRFLAALAKRYDGNPNVAFIDIGSFGVWGEGHSWASSKLPFDLDARKAHVDLYCKHFERTLLAISDDFAGPQEPGAHLPITDYALSKGVTLRDDSICVQPPPHSWFHAELAQAFWPRLPVVLEHEHYGSSKARGAWGDGSLLLQSVEEYHASYMSIHWWPAFFWRRTARSSTRSIAGWATACNCARSVFRERSAWASPSRSRRPGPTPAWHRAIRAASSALCSKTTKGASSRRLPTNHSTFAIWRLARPEKRRRTPSPPA